jgi:NADP-dependent 3-hydroxy acid dehydrogenase YdfG
MTNTTTKTIAIVGAGPGLGTSMAHRFGREGFHVGLLARNSERLDAMQAALADDGISASAHVADVVDRATLRTALGDLEDARGSIDVLACLPTPAGAELKLPEDVDVESVMHQLDYTVLGPIEATQAVLPGMLARGDGALLYTGGYSSRHPVTSHANAGIALAAQRNYAYVLNRALAGRGVYAGTVTVAGLILRSTSGDEILAAPDEVRTMLEPLLIDPDDIADVYWDMYQQRDRAEEVVGKPELVEQLIP